MSRKANQVTVRVPGSTSNCGAGFDTLGMAVALHNDVTLTALDNGAGAQPQRESDGRAREMVAEAAELFFNRTKRTPFAFSYRIEGKVPATRGLGSSVTVRAGIIAGLDALTDTGLNRHQMVAMVTALEGHPDNAAASILGGFCVARADPTDGAYVDSIRIEVPAELVFVTASPLVEIATKESRGRLPAKLPYFDAVRSINSAAYLVGVFATGRFDLLSGAVSDFMHEPYRLPHIPGAGAAIASGVAAGALTGWLSGSGSSVMCVCRREQAETVLLAMREQFAADHLACEGAVLQADNVGLQLA